MNVSVRKSRTASGDGNERSTRGLSVVSSDNFSFQNNGIKKVHMLENNVVVFWNTMGFLKAMFFLTRLHTCFILIIKHLHFIHTKTIHVLH